MRIPFLDLKAINQEIVEEINAASQRALQSGWYILGKENETFESALKESLVGGRQGYAVKVVRLERMRPQYNHEHCPKHRTWKTSVLQNCRQDQHFQRHFLLWLQFFLWYPFPF